MLKNRHGLVVSRRLSATTGTAWREAAMHLVEAVPDRHRLTVDVDKAMGLKTASKF